MCDLNNIEHLNNEQRKLHKGVNAKYKRSGLGENEMQRILRLLLKYMEEYKPYLKNNLTIYDLSEEINIPKHYISQVINEKLHKNFYTFINEYKVKEFKKRLLDPQNSNFTILSIAFESGFNSKTGFNTIFKKIEKLTPSEYLNQYSNK